MTENGRKVLFNEIAQSKDTEALISLLEEYKNYKTNFAKNIQFDPTNQELSI